MRVWERGEAHFGPMGVVRLAREHQKCVNCALNWRFLDGNLNFSKSKNVTFRDRKKIDDL